MKKFFYLILALVATVTVYSCDDTETYADQKDKERGAINRFIADSAITVISESQFKEQGESTDLSKNEYVYINKSGVYLQIVRKGCGEKIKKGETATVLCRFTERNLLTDSIQLSNDILQFSSIVEKMNVTNTSGTFTGSFVQGESLMTSFYGSTSVPGGWLVPLSYINVGRPKSATDQVAKINIIVPHTQGQAYASSSVYPCFYTITYERGR